MSDKKFNILQAFKTKEIFQTSDPLKHLFEQKQFESETSFEISSRKIKDDLHDITLTVNLKTRDIQTKEGSYNIIVSYSGIFEIAGFEGENELKKVKETHAAMMLYPYCRAAINGIISDSTYPNATIPTINFFAVFEEKEKQESQKSET